MEAEETSKCICDAIADACEKDPKKASVLIDTWERHESLFPEGKTAVLAIDVERNIELFDASEASQAECLRDTHRMARAEGLRAAIFVSFRNKGAYLPCDVDQVAFFAHQAKMAIENAGRAGILGRLRGALKGSFLPTSDGAAHQGELLSPPRRSPPPIIEPLKILV